MPDTIEELDAMIEELKAQRAILNGEIDGMAYNSDGDEISIDFQGYGRSDY